MENAKAPVIEVKRLFHTYLTGTPFEAQSLKNINLKVHKGETVGIIGPTGSGKSTLLYHLNGLFRPQKGEVIIMSHSLSDPSTDILFIRKKIGLVFQNPEKQLFERYAGDDVAFGPRNLYLSQDEIRNRVREAMELVGLPFSYKDRLIAGLSVGEKRRLAIAGILAMDPEILVLDEPTTGLDPEGKRNLFRIVELWRYEKGRAAVIVSHNMEDIAELSDFIYVLSGGEIIMSGTPEEVFSHSSILIKNGLGLPAGVKLMQRLMENGYKVSSSCFSTEDIVKEIEGLFNAKKR